MPSSTNTTFFTVTPASADIESGESETFTVTFNYNSGSLGEKTSTITFTPDENEENSISISASANAISDFSISPDEAAAFGSVTTNANKVYTITNHTGSSVNITPSITGTDAAMFSVSPDEATSIADGESQDFTVTFNYELDVTKFGNKQATITFTPDNSKEPFAVTATATATTEVVLDENNATTWTNGNNKSVLIKYQPSQGWNTLCVPINTSNCIPEIFGSHNDYGTNYYILTDYDDGTLTFQKKNGNVVSANTPCLVYVSTAKDNSDGVLMNSTYVYYASTTTPGSTNPTGTTATLQGTYVRKDYVENDDWYGVTFGGQIKKAGTGAYVKGFRAYFTGISAPTTGGNVKMIVLEGEDDTTDLGFTKMVDENAKDVYNLSGQRVQKGGKGIYIVNGKKVVIK